ncbi:hypothetical protein OS493_030136, partial [Desmophyllum pertusum]
FLCKMDHIKEWARRDNGTTKHLTGLLKMKSTKNTPKEKYVSEPLFYSYFGRLMGCDPFDRVKKCSKGRGKNSVPGYSGLSFRQQSAPSPPGSNEPQGGCI